MESQKQKRTFFQNLTLRKVLIVTAIYLVGMFLILLAMTDRFENLKFDKQYSFLLVILIADTVIVGIMWKKYLDQRKQNRE